MKLKILIIILVFTAVAPVLYAAIDLSGGIRNDAIVLKTTNAYTFSDILENKLVFSRKADEWRFYADLRIYAYYGKIASSLANAGAGALGSNAVIPANIPLNYSLNLLRAFIRYESPVGIWTVGKTYVNFGNFGIFNPFEISKSINFNDLSYDKEGMLALLYEASINDLSGLKIYIAPQTDLTNSAIGGSFFGNWMSFDEGIVYNRKGINTNIIGVYIKGDLEAGINVSYGYHFDDYFTNRFNEASTGIDYNFLDGKLITGLTYYYDERGAEKTNDYNPLIKEDVYFSAKHYLYGNIMYTYDEFLTFQLNIFWNLIDLSSLIMPSIKYTLSDGLDFTLLFMFITGKESQEFSRDTLGEYALNLRLEAKL